MKSYYYILVLLFFISGIKAQSLQYEIEDYVDISDTTIKFLVDMRDVFNSGINISDIEYQEYQENYKEILGAIINCDCKGGSKDSLEALLNYNFGKYIVQGIGDIVTYRQVLSGSNFIYNRLKDKLENYKKNKNYFDEEYSENEKRDNVINYYNSELNKVSTEIDELQSYNRNQPVLNDQSHNFSNVAHLC